PDRAVRSRSLLLRRDVKSALALERATPAAGAQVLAGDDRRRARLAPDRRIATLVQRVIRDVVRVQVAPHLVVGPRDERVDLVQAELAIALDDLGRRALRRLVAANRRDPRRQAGERLPE